MPRKKPVYAIPTVTAHGRTVYAPPKKKKPRAVRTAKKRSGPQTELPKSVKLGPADSGREKRRDQAASTQRRTAVAKRNERELREHGFAGASQREMGRRQAAVARQNVRGPKATKGPKFKPPTRKEAEATRKRGLEMALEQSGVFDIAEKASRVYGDKSPQGRVFSMLAGPAGELGARDKALYAATAFPLFRPIRGAKAAVAGLGALRAGLGRGGARAAAEAAYKTPTLAKGARKIAGAGAAKISRAAPPVAAKAAEKVDLPTAKLDLEASSQRLAELDKEYEKRVAQTMPMFKPDPKSVRLETSFRNVRRNRLKGGVRHGKLKTVNEEARQQAEDALEAFAEKMPAHPVAKMVAERKALRAAVNAQAESAFDLPVAKAATQAAPAPKIEIPEAAQLAPETRVREALGPARARRAAQQGLYREERQTRVAKAAGAEQAAGGGVAGYRAAGAELRGEMPKVQFEHLRQGKLTQGDLDQLFRTVQEHPDLRFYEKRRAQDALLNAFEHGRTPQKSQIKLLRTVFGEDAEEIARMSKMQRFGQAAIHAINAPRSLMASFDLSAPFRQGLVAGAGHPKIFAKNFRPMIRAARSEKAYQGIMDDLASRPNADIYRESGLKLTDLTDLSTREEQFASSIAEKLPPVRASARGYVGFLNKMRADVFDSLLETARAEGVNVEDGKFLRGIAKYVNSSTGRGSLGRAEEWAPALNAIFFSPRLMASRINFLDPTWYIRLEPYARKQALKSMLRLMSAASVVLGLGAYAGAKVNLDPRNADFAKLKLGNTRLDLLGGFQQYVRLVGQLTSGQIVSSSTGEIMNLGPGLGELSRKDIAERFAVSKFAPPPSFVYDFFKGTDFTGKPFEIKKAMLQRITPFIAQDVADLYRDTGSVPLSVGGAGLIGFGFGMQTYSNQSKLAKVKTKHDEYGELMAEGIRKTGLGKGLTPQLTKALEVRTARYENRQKMGADDTRERFEADVIFLRDRKVIPKAAATKAIEWAHHTERDYLVERELRHLSDWYFDDLYGDALAEAKQILRDKGYDLPTLPR